MLQYAQAETDQIPRTCPALCPTRPYLFLFDVDRNVRGSVQGSKIIHNFIQNCTNNM